MTGDHLHYRSIRPDLSSSSPLANLRDLQSSEPLSPGSPTPTFRRIENVRGDGSSTAAGVRANAFLDSPTNSHPDPFSANAKASPNSHPSFGKDQLRKKHLRDSPNGSAELRSSAWAKPSVSVQDDALGRHFFDSSDDNLSSEPGTFSFAAAGTSRSSMSSAANISSGARTGLGIQASNTMDVGMEDGLCVQPHVASGPILLGEAFREPLSPTLGKAGRNRPFKRNISSSRDPMSGAGTLDLATSRVVPPASTGSPRVQRDVQRRRLVGTSPKKLSRAAQVGRFPSGGYEDEDSDEGPAWESKVPAPVRVKSTFDWPGEIGKFYDRVDSTLVLDARGLTSIDPAVADLAKYVMLSKGPMLQRDDQTSTPPSSSSSGVTPFSRTNSMASANEALATNSPPATAPQRTRSTNAALGQQMGSGPQLNFANNRIQKLPSALFAVTNMTMLSIRGNKIGRLPAGIGTLVNLKELNVSLCGLSYLPAEIQQLRLVRFTSFPNPFLQPRKDARLTFRRAYGHRREDDFNTVKSAPATPPSISMGPPAVPARARLSAAAQFEGRTSFAAAGQRSGAADEASATEEMTGGETVVARVLADELFAEMVFPNLKEVCMRRLLQPPREADGEYAGDGSLTLLERYEAGSLSRLDGGINADIVRTLEAARRSAAGVWDRYRPDSRREETWCSGASFHRGHSDRFDEGEASAEWSSSSGSQDEGYRSAIRKGPDVEAELDQGDDACHNPWFNRCPSPGHGLHATGGGGGGGVGEDVRDWPVGDRSRVFDRACVQRVEWVSHVGGCKVASVSVTADRLVVREESLKPLAEHSGCIPVLWRGCSPRCLDFLYTV